MVDHLYVVERLDLRDTRTRVDDRRVSIGGMAANAAVQAAHLRCATHLLSCLGDDPDGRFLRHALRAGGVRTQHVLLDPRVPTTVSVVLVARRGGERRFLVPDRRPLEARAPDFDLRLVDRHALLLVDGHFPAQALRAVRRAREVGAPVIADLASPRAESAALLPYVDYPIVPQEFANALANGDARATLAHLADMGARVPVVTQGRRGGLYREGGRVRRFRAHPVRVRDTTGAGDVFHGAFAAAIFRGLDPARALDFAARAAAVSCTALGATTALLPPSALRARPRARRPTEPGSYSA